MEETKKDSVSEEEIIDRNVNIIKRKWEAPSEDTIIFEMDQKGNIVIDDPIDLENAHTDLRAFDESRIFRIKKICN